MNQKLKFISKTVKFGNEQLTLFSIDGTTWSTRKDELILIKDRHEAEKVTAAHLRGEPGEAAPVAADGSKPAAAPAKPARKFPMSPGVKGGTPKVPGQQYPHPATLVQNARIAAEAAKKKEAADKLAKESKESKKVAQKAAPAKKVEAASPKKRVSSKPTQAAKKVSTKKKVAA